MNRKPLTTYQLLTGVPMKAVFWMAPNTGAVVLDGLTVKLFVAPDVMKRLNELPEAIWFIFHSVKWKKIDLPVYDMIGRMDLLNCLDPSLLNFKPTP